MSGTPNGQFNIHRSGGLYTLLFYGYTNKMVRALANIGTSW